LPPVPRIKYEDVSNFVQNSFRPTPLIYFPEQQILALRIMNGGRGPALFVRATLDPLGLSPENWHLGAIAAGDEVQLAFANVVAMAGGAMQVLLDYRDLAGRIFASAMVLTRAQQAGRDI
jgi:hypothetical protein